MIKEQFMNLALTMAESTIGQTSPNPSVGAVVVKDGKILGMGSHLEPGKGHAEVLALEQAGSNAEGAEMYVTLEPCAHFGKTPPCADLIIEHKLKKVYVACLDPNPAVAGKGVERMRQAGIEVEVGLLQTRGEELNRKFFHFIKTQRPYVTLKAAMTLDGKTATVTGDSKWITSSVARLDVHEQRSIHDAILAGVDTVLHDNPQLTARLPQGGKNPIRIILDTNLRITKDRLVLTDNEAPTWIICGKNANADEFSKEFPDVKIFQLDTAQIDVEQVLELLGEKQILSLYVEGGSTVHRSFVKKQLFNECHWYVAPKILGGQDALTTVGGQSPTWMKDAVDLDFVSIERIGPDIKIVARPRRGE